MEFTLQTKIAAALKARPDLKEILPAFHPAFKKLQNPILARTLTRLVTIADAAKIAGVDSEALLAVMNTPGVPKNLPPKPAQIETTARPPWYRTDLITELDVRPQLAAGDDPFKIIIGATRELPAGGILELIASFEPAPIIRVLQKQGWGHWVRWEGDACHVAFFYVNQSQVGGDKANVRVPAERLQKLADGWVIDVRGLEPPQPMVYVLRTLEDTELILPLTVKHQRVPSVLFANLDDKQYKWSTAEHDEGVDIVIEKVNT